MRATSTRRMIAALGAALSMGAAAACAGRQVAVTTGEAPAAESSISFTNNLAQAVNVYVTPATGGGEIFVRQVPARSAEVIPVRGVAPGTAAKLRATPVDGSLNYSRDNVVLGAGFAWTVP